MLPRTSTIVSLALATSSFACAPSTDEWPGEGAEPNGVDSDSDSETLHEPAEAVSTTTQGEPEEEPERWYADLPFVSPPWWKCGDKIVDPWEECDDGVFNGETEACTPRCTLAVCGDEYVSSEEECDLGPENGQNPGEYGSCTSNCEVDVGCGDDEIQPEHEECDEGPQGDTKCTPNCEWFGRVIFVTAAAYTGSQIGGLTHAKELCKDEAEGHLANPGLFRAWLSTGTSSVSDWLAVDAANSKIMRPDGVVIADTLALLKSSDLKNPINVTAAGEELQLVEVWTNTTVAGEAASGVGDDVDDCNDWTSDDGDLYSYRGVSGALNSSWSHIEALVKCNQARHLYCLEQPDNGN